MSDVPASIIAPIREEFPCLLPKREDARPLGCHNPLISDGIVFHRIILALVSGMGYERVADEACSATTIRRRRDEWIEAGVVGGLVLAVLRAYDTMVGLELEELAADGCITKAPTGGETAGRSPVDRGKQGLKRSQLTRRLWHTRRHRPGRGHDNTVAQGAVRGGGLRAIGVPRLLPRTRVKHFPVSVASMG